MARGVRHAIGLQKYLYTFKADAGKVTGKANVEVGDNKREVNLREAKIEGDSLTFVEMFKFQDNEIRISQGVHAYLQEKNVPHVWHVDGNAHDATHWRNNLYLFSQRLFR